jgi:radical SAM peptide maturase (CXXX-repeat target family)
MTLSPDNIIYLYDAVKNLISLGYISISLNCVFEEGWTIEHAKILYQELKKIADWLFETDSFRKYRISLFDSNYFEPLDENETSNWCGGICNGMLAFDYKGDAFPCIRYMASSLNGKQQLYSIGNINGLFKKPEEQKRFELLSSITRQSQSSEECLSCPIAKGCAWCSAYNYECFGTPNKRATFICWMHKARALANYYYYNKGYALLEEEQRMSIFLSEKDALQIISKTEWDELKSYECK